jgi:hypothetical protein
MSLTNYIKDTTLTHAKAQNNATQMQCTRYAMKKIEDRKDERYEAIYL